MGPADDSKSGKVPPQPPSSKSAHREGLGVPPTTGSPGMTHPPPHLAHHYESLKAGVPMYNAPYPGNAGPPRRHPSEQPPPEQELPTQRGEFSGLVSYFSAQHDDLEQQ